MPESDDDRPADEHTAIVASPIQAKHAHLERACQRVQPKDDIDDDDEDTREALCFEGLAARPYGSVERKTKVAFYACAWPTDGEGRPHTGPLCLNSSSMPSLFGSCGLVENLSTGGEGPVAKTFTWSPDDFELEIATYMQYPTNTAGITPRLEGSDNYSSARAEQSRYGGDASYDASIHASLTADQVASVESAPAYDGGNWKADWSQLTPPADVL
mmetsp:Transcript_30785/g.70602  ORF Transcript_30785/g.70602 Transcript_30785/m.70602 type:complete len:215 (+) Transcript_30785:53-697(+)